MWSTSTLAAINFDLHPGSVQSHCFKNQTIGLLEKRKQSFLFGFDNTAVSPELGASYSIRLVGSYRVLRVIIFESEINENDQAKPVIAT
jgi:hypothetical protein